MRVSPALTLVFLSMSSRSLSSSPLLLAMVLLVLARLLPDDVTVVVADADMWISPASKAEEAEVAGAAPGRVAEFRAGRAAARNALSRLGITGHDLLRHGRRPVWPSGIVGAITHTDDFCAVAVASSTAYVGIGIDAEQLDRPITGGVRDRICSPDELSEAAAIDDAAHIIFSAKEAYFKAYHPATDHWIGFDDARVSIDAAAGTFTVELVAADAPRPAGLGRVVGRYQLDERRVASAIAATAATDV